MGHNNKGVTVIEALAIGAVIVLLAYLGYFVVTTSQKKVRDQKRMQNVHKLFQSMVAYLFAENKMPPNHNNGDFLCSDDNGFLSELIAGGFLKKVPKDGKFKYCYYDYGPNNNFGGVIGIRMEVTEINPVCKLNREDSWCNENYYCLCQPYKMKSKKEEK